ncbi:MAG: Rid family hydrolase [Acidimicrobiia bacterium]|nr:Rid family hydrolase [Acidimicrobiia bacterium]
MAGRAVAPVSFPWLDPSHYSFALGIEGAGATWLSGQTASAYDAELGRVDVSGDPRAQATLCWEKVERVLSAAGRTFADCSEVTEYLTEDGLAARAEIDGARPTDRAPSTMVVESLVRPTAVVEIEVVAGRSSGLTRLPQILPVDADGQVVAPGDFVSQCEWVLDEAGRQLALGGLDLGHVVKTVQQTTPATRKQYRDTAEARRRLLGPAFPSSTGVLTPALHHPEVLVALDLWASSETKHVVPYAEEAYASLTFSPAVTAGELLFVSGTTAWDPASGETVAPDDVAGQAEFVYDQIGRVCEAAGTGLDNVIKTIEYVTPAAVDRYREVGAVRERLLGRPFPASTGVVVAGLLGRSWQIEVEAVALLS